MGDFFEDDYTALQLLNTYLDDPEYRNEEASKALDWMKNKLVYKDKMLEMLFYMDRLVIETRAVKDTDRFKDIVEWIEPDWVFDCDSGERFVNDDPRNSLKKVARIEIL